jgi:DNA-binding NarL/FixJ family response regulator
MQAPSPVVLIATPYPLLSHGIRLALRASNIPVSLDAASRDAAVRAAAAGRPAACLVDTELPGGGLAAVRDIGRVSPNSAVIVLADDYSDADVVAAVRAGAVGFVDKAIDAGSLAPAIRAGMAGEAVVPRRLVGHLMTALRTGGAEAQAIGSNALTRRELEVLQLMRSGLSTSAIAARLVVAPVTVRTHVCAIRRKLQLLGDAVVPFPARREPPSGPNAPNADGPTDEVMAHILRIS